MPYCLPCHAPSSLSADSHWLPFRSFTESVTSSSVPCELYYATCVLPSSITSGPPLVLVSAVVSFWPMPFHCWTSYLTLTPGCAASKSLSIAATVASGAEPLISQTVRVLSPPPLPLLAPPPQPAATIDTAATPTAATIHFLRSPLCASTV